MNFVCSNSFTEHERAGADAVYREGSEATQAWEVPRRGLWSHEKLLVIRVSWHNNYTFIEWFKEQSLDVSKKVYDLMIGQ